jgi:hypothetical protein
MPDQAAPLPTPQPYLDYLDKEMTIMGILSAFAVAAPAGILVTSIGKDSAIANQLWSSAEVFILAGSTLCLMASGFFYKERSLLAAYFGKISFLQTDTHDPRYRKELKEWLDQANSFATWWPYCCAFTLLFAGFAEYLAGIFLFVVPTHSTFISKHLHLLKGLSFWFIPLAAATISIAETYARIANDTSIWVVIGSRFTDVSGDHH